MVNWSEPYILSDPDNVINTNPIVAPIIHIKPELYFLFAYAILRSIPNKLDGLELDWAIRGRVDKATGLGL